MSNPDDASRGGSRDDLHTGNPEPAGGQGATPDPYAAQQGVPDGADLPPEHSSQDDEPDDVDPADDGPGGDRYGGTADGSGDAAALRSENEDLKDQLLRARAETENVRKRAGRDAESGRRFAAAPVVTALLPVMDNLRRAVDAAKAGGDPQELVTGVGMVLGEFERTFAAHGVRPIEAVGNPLDPNRHEAVAQRPDADAEPMTVLQEVEPGYLLHDRVLRPAKVIVAAES